jgi:hypothetical protein
MATGPFHASRSTVIVKPSFVLCSGNANPQGSQGSFNPGKN